MEGRGPRRSPGRRWSESRPVLVLSRLCDVLCGVGSTSSTVGVRNRGVRPNGYPPPQHPARIPHLSFSPVDGGPVSCRPRSPPQHRVDKTAPPTVTPSQPVVQIHVPARAVMIGIGSAPNSGLFRGKLEMSEVCLFFFARYVAVGGAVADCCVHVASWRCVAASAHFLAGTPRGLVLVPCSFSWCSSLPMPPPGQKQRTAFFLVVGRQLRCFAFVLTPLLMGHGSCK